MTRASRIYAVVLAAGGSRRFGSPKLLAPLDGRPVLQHVLDTLAGAPLAGVVVVLGEAADALEAAIEWRTARRVRNPDAAAGLSTSLQCGIAALPDDATGALIVLGDQPRLSMPVVTALLTADPGRAAAVVPRYADGVRGHPVLLLRTGFRLVAGVHGDRGLGPVLDARPELAIEVPVPGDNPDVDTPADLARLAASDALRLDAAALERAWSERVRAEREQVERLREVPPDRDFYAPIRSVFVADPRRTGDASLDALLELARPGDTWLDVGAGAGRYALPLALRVREVIAVEPSPGMAAALEAAGREHGIGNVRLVRETWPMEAPPAGDVALLAHVGYDVEAIAPFLDALEAAAGRLCVAALAERWPGSAFGDLWAAAHGEPRRELPALPELLALLLARRRLFEVRLVERPPRGFASRDELHEIARHQLFVRPGGAADARLRDAIAALPVERDGSILLRSGPRSIGIVSWAPEDSRPTRRSR